MSEHAGGQVMVDVSVVLSTYNRAKLLESALNALALQKVPDSLSWEVVVVDNNSRDTTPRVVAAFSETTTTPVRYVFEPQQGQSYGRNRGIKEARGSIVAFIDDDVIAAPDWVVQVMSAINRWNSDGVGGRILPQWEGTPPRWLTQSPRLLNNLAIMDFEEHRVLSMPMKTRPRVWGANMAFRRDVFERIGGFDTGLGMVGTKLFRGEDTEIINRAIERDLKIVYDPALTVLHRIGPERMQKAYFRKLRFDIGQGEARARPIGSARSFLGAPLYLYRETFIEFWKWLGLTLRRRPEAFDQELDCLLLLGRLSVYWTVGR